MTKEFVKTLATQELQMAHRAYSQLAVIYENVCGGPYKAREHKEYFAIMDSRENLRQEYNKREILRDGNNTNTPT